MRPNPGRKPAIAHASKSCGPGAASAREEDRRSCMDFDIWVNAQDWEIKKLKVDLLKK